MKVDVEL